MVLTKGNWYCSVKVFEILRYVSKKFGGNAKNLKKQNIELTGEVQETGTQATVESARLEAIKNELINVKKKLTASRVEGTYSRWSDHSSANVANKVKDEVCKAPLAVTKEDVTMRLDGKFLSMGWNEKTN